MRVLIVTTDEAERDVVAVSLHGPSQTRKHRHGQIATVATAAGIVDIAAGGIGPIATASTTGWLLGSAAQEGSVYSAVVVLGFAAGYPGGADVGDVVVADRVVDADLGVQTELGFRPPETIGLEATTSWELVSPPPPALLRRISAAGLTGRSGTVVTSARMTLDPHRADELSERYAPIAEASTGAGALVATLGLGDVGFAEVRVVDREVGAPPAAHTQQILTRLGVTAEAVFDQTLPR